MQSDSDVSHSLSSLSRNPSRITARTSFPHEDSVSAHEDSMYNTQQKAETGHAQHTRSIIRSPFPDTSQDTQRSLPSILDPRPLTDTTLHSSPTQRVESYIPAMPTSIPPMPVSIPPMSAPVPPDPELNTGTHPPQTSPLPNSALSLPLPDIPTQIVPAVQRQTRPLQPAMNEAGDPQNPTEETTKPSPPKKMTRWLSIAMVVALLAALYFLWQPLTLPFGNTTTSSDESDLATSDAVNGDLSDSQSSAQTTATTASSSATATTASTSGTSDTAKIQVYIVGAVYHPGLYSLDASARLYQLVQAAGGPLPDADMTALNMAAQLTDGQEIYVLRVNETPPATIGSDSTIAMGGSARGSSSSSASSKTATATSHAAATSTALANQGPKININTATSTELQQGLGIGSQTANEIITYRVQHGSYKTVADLANAVSSSMYSKLKNKVMV